MTRNRYCHATLFANTLHFATLYYDVFDRLSIEPSCYRTPIFNHKMRSRKGSVKTTVHFVAELLPRGDI